MFNQFLITFGLFVVIMSSLTYSGVYYLDLDDKNLFFIITLMITFVFGGMGIFLVRNMYVGIEKLTKNIDKFSVDNQTLLKIERNDEVGKLGNAINKLNKKFHEKTKHYEKINSELKSLDSEKTYKVEHLHNAKIKLSKTVIDLTEQKELEKKYLRELEWRSKIVKNLVVKHKKIDQQKSEFASMIAHDLKTPLTPIIGWCSILEQGMYGPLNTKQLKSIQRIKENANTIHAMMGDLLDVRKMDLHKMKFNFSDMNTNDLVQSVYDDYEGVMKKDNIEFVISCNEKIILYGDKLRTEQVLKNFLLNAIDFVGEDGKIEMYTRRHDPYVTFYVKDNGIGIANDKQKDLFNKFYQVDSSTTRKHGGSGLGLAICKGIVEGMNGLIGVESHIGEGSIFYFSLPLKKFVVPDPNFSTRKLN